ncbi:MAG: hypothetical protein ABIZ81_18680 [Opitutaceae bacterium]
MLRALFQWFDTHPHSYWLILTLPSLLWLASAVQPIFETGKRRGSWKSDAAFLVLLLGTLVAWRWPHWLNANPFNPDESQFIAGAITLTRDPLFWRAVDGTTSGPLNFYALLPLHGLGLPLDYFSARLTGVLLVWMAIVGCYRLFVSWYGVAPGRLAVLPLTAFFAVATDADFLHYSSEHVPLALIAIAAWGLFRCYAPGEKRWGFLAGGLVAGMLPWAKLQTAPIAATLVLLALGRVMTEPDLAKRGRIRAGLKLIGAAALPSLVIIMVIGAAGQLGHLYRDYLVQNFSYLDQNWSTGSAVRQLWVFSLESRNLPAFGGIAIALIVFAGIAGKAASKKAFIAAGILTGVAVWCVVAPKRPSLHYTLLAIIPLGLWAGTSIGELWNQGSRISSRRLWAAVAAVGALGVIVGIRAAQGAPAMFGEFADHWRRPRSATGNIVRALTNPDDRLAVWGWMDRVYVETGLPQATRESETFEQIAPSRQQQHYRDRYVGDITRTRPAVFIDATGPGAPYFNDRAASSHEIVPALAEFVQNNYRLLTDLGYALIYVRADRFAARPLSDSELWRMVSGSRRDPDPKGPLSLSPRRLVRKKIYGRTVQMMLPPAEMVWALDGTERELYLDYGFDPKAVESGKGNGAEIIAELQVAEGPPRQVFNRSIDPVKRSDDRGNLSSRIILPPFPPGSKLVVRTTPGEFGDNAWDWIYVGQVDLVRAPFFSPDQFPNYSRVPEAIVSEYSSLLESNGEKLLMTHAPTSMRFSLGGTERRLQFDYGFQPGAYTGDGQTDGATFVVELKRGDQTSSVLFSRQLDPVKSEADRGRLHADITLPALQPGAQLVLRIDAGQSPGWDWTYFTHLQIEETPR